METGAHISATAGNIFSKIPPFFGIDPNFQKNIKFVAGNAKKYAKYAKICS
jgi:hypothetical protein